MNSELSVAVWGLGRHAIRRVLPAIVQSQVIELVGICTRNQELGKAKAAELNCEYFASPDHMLSDDRVQAVLVTTPTGLHFQHGLRVLEAEKHLCCEKPMTHSYQTTCRLFELAAEKNVSAMSGLMYKYHPQFLALKRIIEERTLGELKSLSIKFGMPTLNVDTFRSDPELGGGALLDMSCYPLSVAYQLLTEPPELRCANVATQASSKADTDGWAILEGQGVVVDCEWGMGRAYQNSLQIWGAKGLIVCDRAFTKEDDYDSSLVFYDQRGSQSPVIQTGRANSYRAMIETFAMRLNEPEFFVTERAETEWCAMMTDKILHAS